jgi:mono/diheme cytochrome c family protein
MGRIQLRHIKLWEAIKHRNWDLLDFELELTKDSFGNAVILYRNIPVEFIVAAGKPLAEMQKAAKAKDSSQLERGYAELTAACNACHKAADVGFIVIKTPASSPFGNQEFSPKDK